MNYTVHIGKNNFSPRLPILPFFRNELTYTFRVDPDWIADRSLTTPEGYGLKLFAVGRFNYHEDGANSSIANYNHQLFWSPRYYRNWNLTQVESVRRGVVPNVNYKVRMKLNPLSYWFNNEFICSFGFSVPNFFLTPLYMGKLGVAGASRTVTIQIN